MTFTQPLFLLLLILLPYFVYLGRREFWPWLAVAALGVLVVEWWVYQQGTR